MTARCAVMFLQVIAFSLAANVFKAEEPPNQRTSSSQAELRSWLENMVCYHRFTTDEISAATGMSADQVKIALEKLRIRAENKPRRPADAPLLVLPYPGGRHPRIGFLEGAVRPQRETKISVFCPWDDSSYVVVDVPEAIWSNLGLTYLAHTHVPTVWSKQGIELPALEWNRRPDGTLDIERKLPNGIVFGTRIVPTREAVQMEMWLTNGTKEELTDLRVQVCTLLKGAKGFEAQTNDDKIFSGSYAGCKSMDGKRWIITAWEPLHRTWANSKCPCLHSDPKFPDCPPGETVRVNGWLSFYEGADVKEEFQRLDQLRTENKPKEKMAVRLRGKVLDARTDKPIPCRIYLQSEDGHWFHVKSAVADGSAVPYDKRHRGQNSSVEIHTTISAHPFVVDLLPGKYTLTVERGKEWHSQSKQIVVGTEPIEVQFKLERWINMAELGWYAGDTHVHRSLGELPNVMLAEDLNVALPLLHWVTEAFVSPTKNSRNQERDPGKLIEVDKTHVIYPRNTEYEIFTVGKAQHTLGAFFVLNHHTDLDRGVPPVGKIAELAHKEKALIELDKHNWPWSMMLVPVMPVDLYELSNNHIWRTEFAMGNWAEPPADYMKIERGPKGWTESSWIEYGFQNYYALLNCGFRLKPTAGTASGVHPVPLGFGRVYVTLPDGFSYDGWMQGLGAGRSFVTTGPMLLVKFKGKSPGHTFKQTTATSREYHVEGLAVSAQRLGRIEIVVNGEIAQTIKPENRNGAHGAFECPIDAGLKIDGTSWIIVRCFEDRADQRPRFAHSSPVFIDVPDKPLRPKSEELEYLIKRVEDQIARNENRLPKEAVDEYRDALRIYKSIGSKEVAK